MTFLHRFSFEHFQESYQPSAYDYDTGDLLMPAAAATADETMPRYRKTQRPVWKGPSAVADEDAAYGSSGADYTADDTSASDYELDNRDYRDRYVAMARSSSGLLSSVPENVDRSPTAPFIGLVCFFLVEIFLETTSAVKRYRVDKERPFVSRVLATSCGPIDSFAGPIPK